MATAITSSDICVAATTLHCILTFNLSILLFYAFLVIVTVEVTAILALVILTINHNTAIKSWYKLGFNQSTTMALVFANLSFNHLVVKIILRTTTRQVKFLYLTARLGCGK